MRCCSTRPNPRARIAGLVLAIATVAATAALPTVPALAATHKPAAKHTVRPTARAAASCVDADLVPTSANLTRIAAATLCLINQQRTAAHLVALRTNAALTTAAAMHSADMVSLNYFDHNSPTGSTPQSRITAAGYIKPNHSWSIGENIAAATGSLATPASMVTMWMNSAGHRANILNPAFRDTGIGAVAAVPALLGSGPGGTYTEDFGVTS
jgi:uncharacterized protein YkwD